MKRRGAAAQAVPRAGAWPAARRLAVALCIAAGAAALPASAQSAAASADEVKAAYLYRFIGYVEWPPRVFTSAQSPIVIGVVGADAVLADLDGLVKGRTAEGRPVSVRELARDAPLEGIHVLFISKDVIAPRSWLQRARENSVLVVTESPQGLAGGGVLNFVLADHRVRFEASLAAAEQSGLKLSSRLLAVASRVVTER
jgi:hypothetical protein